MCPAGLPQLRFIWLTTQKFVFERKHTVVEQKVLTMFSVLD